jgi:rubrerythrin
MPELPAMNADALADMLCERLAVETHGVELYRAVLAKMPEPKVAARLEHFMHEEAQHRDLLSGYLDRLGVGERETPSARLAAHEGEAYARLIGEAQTAPQLLNILLTVELMDETGWEMLINLGRDLGDADMVSTFQQALKEEKEHLRGVRGMLAQMTRDLVLASAHGEAAAAPATAEAREESDEAVEASDGAEATA